MRSTTSALDIPHSYSLPVRQQQTHLKYPVASARKIAISAYLCKVSTKKNVWYSLLNGEERRRKNHPFGLGKNVLGVLVQVQLRMVQIPESNGSIFSGDVWSEFIKSDTYTLPKGRHSRCEKNGFRRKLSIGTSKIVTSCVLCLLHRTALNALML